MKIIIYFQRTKDEDRRNNMGLDFLNNLNQN